MVGFDVRKIAVLMGGDVVGRNSVNVPGPRHSPADRSLTIKLEPRAPSRRRLAQRGEAACKHLLGGAARAERPSIMKPIA
jgi:hypothetical protein